MVLRFFAFFVVFVHHACCTLGYHWPTRTGDFIKTNFLQNGDMGVAFFFVLSGFLITYLLLVEKGNVGKINIPNFYMRRVLRIFPVYFAVVFCCLFVFPKFTVKIPEHFPINPALGTLNKWLYILFASNFDYIRNGINNVLIGPLWSVGVEEQFYLIMPLIVLVAPRKYLAFVFAFLISLSVGWRYLVSDGKDFLIPFVKALVPSVDIARGRITINPPGGLIDED